MKPSSTTNIAITKTQDQKVITSNTPSMYKCWSCIKEFKTERGLKLHNTRMHKNQTKHRCYNCNVEFPYLSTLTAHRKIHATTRKDILKNIAKRKMTADELASINSKRAKTNISAVQSDSLPNNTANISLSKQQISTAFNELHILAEVATDILKQEYPSSFC
jgi:DNA-directed RNA polymerase subunit RPC12/RpoP